MMTSKSELTAPIKRAILDAQPNRGNGELEIPSNTPNAVRWAMARRGFLASERHVWLLQPAISLLPQLRNEPYPARVRCTCYAWKEPDRDCKWCKINASK